MGLSCRKYFFLLGYENKSLERFGKKKKFQCQFCHEIINKKSMKRHKLNCQLYLELIVQETTCKVCGQHFLSKRSVNQHIGTHHQKELMEIKNQNVASAIQQRKLQYYNNARKQYGKQKWKKNLVHLWLYPLCVHIEYNSIQKLCLLFLLFSCIFVISNLSFLLLHFLIIILVLKSADSWL